MKFIKCILIIVVTQSVTRFAHAQDNRQIVRLAKLVIDSAYLESYKTFLKEGIEIALKAEPGVLTIFAMSEKEKPTHFTILEIYADSDAYKDHIQSVHFQKYKRGTLHMVRSLELTDTDPLMPEFNISQVRKRVK